MFGDREQLLASGRISGATKRAETRRILDSSINLLHTVPMLKTARPERSAPGFLILHIVRFSAFTNHQACRMPRHMGREMVS